MGDREAQLVEVEESLVGKREHGAVEPALVGGQPRRAHAVFVVERRERAVPLAPCPVRAADALEFQRPHQAGRTRQHGARVFGCRRGPRAQRLGALHAVGGEEPVVAGLVGQRQQQGARVVPAAQLAEDARLEITPARGLPQAGRQPRQCGVSLVPGAAADGRAYRPLAQVVAHGVARHRGHARRGVGIERKRGVERDLVQHRAARGGIQAQARGERVQRDRRLRRIAARLRAQGERRRLAAPGVVRPARSGAQRGLRVARGQHQALGTGALALRQEAHEEAGQSRLARGRRAAQARGHLRLAAPAATGIVREHRVGGLRQRARRQPQAVEVGAQGVVAAGLDARAQPQAAALGLAVLAAHLQHAAPVAARGETPGEGVPQVVGHRQLAVAREEVAHLLGAGALEVAVERGVFEVGKQRMVLQVDGEPLPVRARAALGHPQGDLKGATLGVQPRLGALGRGRRQRGRQRAEQQESAGTHGIRF
jgi:hypothetical protein